MKSTAKFDQARQSISIEHQVKLLKVRYVPFTEHVQRFHMTMANRFSEMHRVVGTDRSYDQVMSDA